MSSRNRSERRAGPPDQPLIHKSAVMQRLQDLARLGYTRYTSATCNVERLHAMRAKFAMHYSTNASESQRRRQKRWNIPRAFLVIWRPKGAKKARWWLLIENAADAYLHPASEDEKLVSALERANRIRMPAPEGSEVSFDYELKRLDSRWSWVMTQERKAAWEQRIKYAARAQRGETLLARQCAYSLRRVPGFRGIRRDAKDLLKLLRVEWEKANPGSKLPVKTLPPRPMRRVSLRGRPCVNHTKEASVNTCGADPNQEST